MAAFIFFILTALSIIYYRSEKKVTGIIYLFFSLLITIIIPTEFPQMSYNSSSKSPDRRIDHPSFFR